MRTYILLKDLPNAYVGRELNWDESKNAYVLKHQCSVSPNFETLYSAGTVKYTLEFFMEKSEYEKLNKPMEKKIIGYKAPYLLYSGKVEKGTLFIPKGNGYSPAPQDSVRYQGFSLPKEIVETWEAVYKEEKVYTKRDLEAAFESGKLDSHTITKEKRVFEYQKAFETFEDYFKTLDK